MDMKHYNYLRECELDAALHQVKTEELKLPQKLEDQINIEDAWKAENEPGDPLLWEEFKKELEL